MITASNGSLASDQSTMGAVLFVRNIADISLALRGMNELLARRREYEKSNCEILAIFVSEDLEEVLDPKAFESAFSASIHVRFRQSVSLSGVWSLCWFEFTSTDDCPRDHSRKHLLEALLALIDVDLSQPRSPCALLPVFRFSGSHWDFATAPEDLHARYPNLILGEQFFVHDSKRGGLIRMQALDSSTESRLVS